MPVRAGAFSLKALGYHQSHRPRACADIKDTPVIWQHSCGGPEKHPVSIDLHRGTLVADTESLETEYAHNEYVRSFYSSTNCPSRINRDLSHIRARSGSCVTMTIVGP